MPCLRQSFPAFAPSLLLAFFVLFAALSSRATADEPKEPPLVLVAAPLAVAAGESATVTIRGLRLENASEVRFIGAEHTIEAKIKSKGKADVPNQQDAKKVGDTQVEVELTLPAEMPAGEVEFVVVTPDGESDPHRLVVLGQPPVEEKEPNDGFRQAQPLELPATVRGNIHQNQNVDVFRFEGTAGRKVVIEVLAVRYGSALDPMLTLYDGRGRIVAQADTGPAGPDCRLEIELPHDGVYLVSLLDALDRGGPAHTYLLRLK